MGKTGCGLWVCALVANLIASIAGARIAVPNRLRELGLGIIGLMLGSQVTTDLVERLPNWSLSLLLLSVGMVVATYVVTLWYQRCGLETISAFFSALPGGMAAMVMMGERLGIDARGMVIGQSIPSSTLPTRFWTEIDICCLRIQ